MTADTDHDERLDKRSKEEAAARAAGILIFIDKQESVRWFPVLFGRISQQTIITKNEPVVSRNDFHRAGPCKGAKLTPWLWIGGTKEVRIRSCWTWEVRCHRGKGMHKAMQNVK